MERDALEGILKRHSRRREITSGTGLGTAQRIPRSTLLGSSPFLSPHGASSDRQPSSDPYSKSTGGE